MSSRIARLVGILCLALLIWLGLATDPLWGDATTATSYRSLTLPQLTGPDDPELETWLEQQRAEIEVLHERARARWLEADKAGTDDSWSEAARDEQRAVAVIEWRIEEAEAPARFSAQLAHVAAEAEDIRRFPALHTRLSSQRT